MNSVTNFLSFLVMYASTLFRHDAFKGSDFLRVLGIGRACHARTTWFIADHSSQSYGYHLKERMFCLQKLAILLEVMIRANPK
jgi:hypothetical protein